MHLRQGREQTPHFPEKCRKTGPASARFAVSYGLLLPAEIKKCEDPMAHLHEIEFPVLAELEHIPEGALIPEARDLAQEIPDLFLLRGSFPDLSGRCSREIAGEGSHFAALLELLLLEREEILRLERLLVRERISAREMISGRSLPKTATFGGSGFSFARTELDAAFEGTFSGKPGDFYRVKLYFPEEGNAVYAYALLEAPEEEREKTGDSGRVRFSFYRIRPEDEDTIVEMVFAREREFLKKRSDAREREKELLSQNQK